MTAFGYARGVSRKLLLLVALFAIALYAISIPGTFIYDDVAVVLTDGRIADVHRWGEYWTDSYNFGVDNLYRPLVSMTYAIEYWLHAKTAWPYHAVNVVLHSIASAMVAWVAFKLTRERTIALVSGLLFAAHPVHVEAVANIVGRAEPMCAIAMLAAIGLAIGPLTRARVFGIWLCCAFAILCKEQGILAALMVGVVRASGSPLPTGEGLGERTRTAAEDSFAPQNNSQPHAPSPQPSPGGRGSQTFAYASPSTPREKSLGPTLFALLMANVAVIVFVRENLIHLKFWWDRKFLDPWIQPLSDSVGIDRWLVPITIAGRYLGLLVAPITLRIDYGGPIVPGVFEARDPFFWLGVLAIAVFLALAAFAWRTCDRFISVNLALFTIAYALVSNIPTIIGVNVAERLMYLPSAFFVMIVASLLTRLPRKAMIGVVAIVTVLFSIRTVTYAYRWNDRLSFYEYAARVEPRSMKATLLAMQEHADRHEWDAAERYARHAIAIDPSYDDAWLRLAGVLIDKGDWVGAREAIEKAKAIRMTSRVGTYEDKLNQAMTIPTTQPSR